MRFGFFTFVLMEAKKTVNYLVAVIIMLVLGLAGCIGYIVGNNNSAAAVGSGVSTDSKVMKEIDELKQMYDSKIAEKTNSFQELKSQKEKVASLMYALEKSKGDAQALLKYKTEYQNLENKMRVLVNEIVALKSGKKSAVAKAQTVAVTEKSNSVKSGAVKKDVVTKTSLEKAKTETTSTAAIVEVKEKPQVTETAPSKAIESKVAEYRVSNLKSVPLVQKSAGKTEETASASQTDFVKISFTVEALNTSPSDEKVYYIQIINNRGNVMGKRVTEFFGDKSLTYSFTKTLDLTDGSVTVSQELREANFEKGTYFVNVYDKSKLVGNSSFTLR